MPPTTTITKSLRTLTRRQAKLDQIDTALDRATDAMDRLIEEIRHKDAAIRDALRILCAEPFDRNNINDAVVRLTGATTCEQWAEGW